MPQVEIYSCLKFVGLDGRSPVGSLMVPATIEVVGEVFDRTIQVADSSDAELLSIPSNLADFDALSIESDKAVLLEFLVTGSEATDVVFTLELAAGASIVLSSDRSLASYVLGDFYLAPEGSITGISVANQSGETATVRIVAVT